MIGDRFFINHLPRQPSQIGANSCVLPGTTSIFWWDIPSVNALLTIPVAVDPTTVPTIHSRSNLGDAGAPAIPLSYTPITVTYRCCRMLAGFDPVPRRHFVIGGANCWGATYDN